jgi:hypothetical protein
MTYLYQRHESGRPEKNGLLNDSYPDIPASMEFQNQRYGYETAIKVHGYQWSNTFNRWSALVDMPDGWHGFSYPKVGAQ